MPLTEPLYPLQALVDAKLQLHKEEIDSLLQLHKQEIDSFFDSKFHANELEKFLIGLEAKIRSVFQEEIVQNPQLNLLEISEIKPIYHSLLNKFENRINTTNIVNFPKQKQKLLEEVRTLYDIEAFEGLTEKLSKSLISLLNDLDAIEAINARMTSHIQKLVGIKSEIDKAQPVVDDMTYQYKELIEFLDKIIKKINDFDPLQKDEAIKDAEHLLHADLGRLNLDLVVFKGNTESILIKRKENINQIKKEVKSLKLKLTPPFLDSSSEEIKRVQGEIEDFEKSINDIDIYVEENINKVNASLQKMKNTVEMQIAEVAKSKLLNLLGADCDPIRTIRAYKAKLNKGGKTAEKKAIAFSSDETRRALRKQCAVEEPAKGAR